MSDVLRRAEVKYPVLLSFCSARAKHVLSAYQQTFSTDNEFYLAILNITAKEANNLQNCGRLTVKEIMNLSQKLRQSTGAIYRVMQVVGSDMSLRNTLDLQEINPFFSVDCAAVSGTPESSDVYTLADYWYPILLSSCSDRTKYVLRFCQKGFFSSLEFYESILKEAIDLHNCDRITANEIIALSQQLRKITGYIDDKQSPLKTVDLPDDVDRIMPLILAKADSLTVRSRNVINNYIRSCNYSVVRLYARFTSPNFSISKLNNIGRKTIDETQLFFDETKSLIERFIGSSSVDAAANELARLQLSKISIPDEYLDNILAMKEQLGYFPLFATISVYMSGLNDETKAIIEGCIRVHNGQVVQDRKEVAQQVGLTPERVRQKRNNIIEELAEYFANIRKAGFISENPYNFTMVHTEEYINSTEGTDFTANFVRWVLSETFDDITMVGEILKPLTSFYNDDLFVNIVLTEQTQYFDFAAFVAALDEKLAEKRTDEQRVNLKSFMAPFYKVQYYEDYQKDIETSCRSIIYLNYPVDVDMGQMIFQPNSRKNNPDIIEDILRAAGHPMTLDELYDEFSYQYPDRSVAYESFRGNIGKNKNIVPIGRTSTYALVEWQNGTYRGGTIREFASEYLDSIPERIASVESIGNYVRQFRPETEDDSIVANLNQHKTIKFAIYQRDGQRFIGYRSLTYDPSYVLFDPERVTRRSTEESMKLLIDFIKEHKHFPLHQPNDPEETRLSKFVDSMRSIYNRGKMDPATAAVWRDFCDEYGGYKLPRKDAEEVDLIALKISEYLNTIDWSCDFISKDEMISQAIDYYIFVINDFSKNFAFRTLIQNENLCKDPLGLYFLETILDRYVFNTKRSPDWDGREWISEEILKFFEYDDESIIRIGEEMDETRKLIARIRDVQNNLRIS